MCEVWDEMTIANLEPSSMKMSIQTEELNAIEKLSTSSTQRVKDLLFNVDLLKTDIKTVIDRIEHNVELFRAMLSNKLKMIVEMLSEKQLNIDSTLEECYKVIGDLVEIFLNIGYESENDITNLSKKVEYVDKEIKKIGEIVINTFKDDEINKNIWFINNEDKLTVRQTLTVGSVLPKFGSGDILERKQFIKQMEKIFNHYKVAEIYWVNLTAYQLYECAEDWWKSIQNNFALNWLRFIELFIKASLSNTEQSISEEEVSNQTSTTELYPISEENNGESLGDKADTNGEVNLPNDENKRNDIYALQNQKANDGNDSSNNFDNTINEVLSTTSDKTS